MTMSIAPTLHCFTIDSLVTPLMIVAIVLMPHAAWLDSLMMIVMASRFGWLIQGLTRTINIVVVVDRSAV